MINPWLPAAIGLPTLRLVSLAVLAPIAPPSVRKHPDPSDPFKAPGPIGQEAWSVFRHNEQVARHNASIKGLDIGRPDVL